MSLRAQRSNLATTRTPNGIRHESHWMTMRSVGVAGLAVALCFCAPNVVEARPALCFTSDEGCYNCNFVAGPKGSFTISAPGKTTVILDIDKPDVGFGFAKLGGHNVRLGYYHRSKADPACWEKDDVRICAWSPSLRTAPALPYNPTGSARTLPMQ
jgi:hypothetical protein